jgi:hypothetical protein
VAQRSQGGPVERRVSRRPCRTRRLPLGWIAAAIALMALWPAGPAGAVSSPPRAPGPAQLPPPTCQGASTVDPSAELRLVRDVDGAYWQIQTGCRHLVVPFLMDSATLAAIPQGEDVGRVRGGQPAAATRPDVPVPAYALPPENAPRPPADPLPPDETTSGGLRGYAEGALVIDPSAPDAVWLLAGGLRHRVLVYFPYCAVYQLPGPLCGGAEPDVTAALLVRGGDPTVTPPFPYLLPRRPEVAADCRALVRQAYAESGALLPEQLGLPRPQSCVVLYDWVVRDAWIREGASRDSVERGLLQRYAVAIAEEAAGYVATLAEIPVGAPAAPYGWAQGESVLVSDRPRPPAARRCSALPSESRQAQLEECSTRFVLARVLDLGQYNKDTAAYAGQDVRIVGGTACNVRYDRTRDVVTLTFRVGSESVPVVVPGRAAASDPALISNAQLEIAAVASPSTAEFAGQLVVFEYRPLNRTGICEEAQR